MDAERSVLGKAIYGSQLDALVGREVQPEHFVDPECRAVYRSMLEHLAQYGVPPTHEAVRDKHPDFQIQMSGESMDYVMDRFLRGLKRRTAIELFRDFGDAIDDDERVDEIEIVAQEMASRLTELMPQPRIGRWSDEESRIEDYLKRQAKGEATGISTTFPEVDRHTVGIQDHELWVVAGWQNSGKSAVMQRFAWAFYGQGKTPMYITLEMSKEECFERWASMATQMEHRALRAMEYAPNSKQVERWKQVAKSAKEFRADRDIIVLDDIASCTTDRVLVETRRYEPDVVFVDYLELMDASRRMDEWQAINEIGRTLKRNARLKINGRNIPIVVGAQTNADDGGTGATLASISYKSTGKHADVVIGIKRTQEMEAEKVMELLGLKNRNGRRGWVQECRFDPSVFDLAPRGAASDFKMRQGVPQDGIVSSPFRKAAA